MSISESKKTLRRKMRELIRNSKDDSHQIINKILEFISQHPNCECISLYSPLPGEVDLIPILQSIQKTWVFPRVSGDKMAFYKVENPALELTIGEYSILEPNEMCPEVPISEINLFICPGIAFTHSGTRLGRGKGYYDRALSEASNHSLFIGVCFDFQITENIASDKHDIRMHYVMTNASTLTDDNPKLRS